jgi:hypothetical protein
MPSLTILEAFYGGSVVLDYADEEAYELALELCMRTIEKLEDVADATYDVALQNEMGTLSRDAALQFLRTAINPEYRYDAVRCGVHGRKAYELGVLSEDGSCVTIAPSWQADDAWYDVFWAALWDAAMDLERADPSFHLGTVHGDFTCALGHRASPFLETCNVCGRATQPIL